MTVGNLGVNYRDAGRPEEAIPLLEEAFQARKEHPSLIGFGRALQDTYLLAGKEKQAVRLTLEMVAESRESRPADSPQLASMLAMHTTFLLNTRAYVEAEPLVRECLAIREKHLPDSWFTDNSRSQLGGVLLGQKKYVRGGTVLVGRLSRAEGARRIDSRGPRCLVWTRPSSDWLNCTKQRTGETKPRNGRPSWNSGRQMRRKNHPRPTSRAPAPGAGRSHDAAEVEITDRNLTRSQSEAVGPTPGGCVSAELTEVLSKPGHRCEFGETRSQRR